MNIFCVGGFTMRIVVRAFALVFFIIGAISMVLASCGRFVFAVPEGAANKETIFGMVAVGFFLVGTILWWLARSRRKGMSLESYR